MKSIGIIGFGFMGSAIVRGMSSALPAFTLRVVEKDRDRRDAAVSQYNALDCTDTPEEVVHHSDVVILAIKPQDLAHLKLPPLKDKPVLSILAGVSIHTISQQLEATQVIRVMPNLAADIGKAVMGVTFSSSCNQETRERIIPLLKPLGTVIEVVEEKMAAITAVSGSGIAFACAFIEAMALGAVQQGLPYAQAVEAARDVVASAAALLKETGVHPREMVSRVSSPGGTTIAGIRALAEGCMEGVVMDAMQRAADRSREIEAG
jgi:pyrroline-5-carboxylate reductase